MKICEILQESLAANPVSVKIWHGTNATFDKFSKEMARVDNDLYGGGTGYFTDDVEVAKGYARSSMRRKGVKQDARPLVYRVVLNLDNVFDIGKTYDGDFVRSFLKSDSYQEAENFLRNAGMAQLGSDLVGNVSKLQRGTLLMTGDQIFSAIGERSKNSSKARDILIQRGFDGLTHPGGLRGGTKGLHTVYIAYDNEKIELLKRYRLKN